MKKRALSAIFAAFMAMSAMTACGNDASRRLEDAVANAGQTVSSTPAQSAPNASTSEEATNGATASGNDDDINYQTIETPSADNGVDVDKNLLSVEITVPADQADSLKNFLSDDEMNDLQMTTNADGSITYKMSKSQHMKLLRDIKQAVDDYSDELLSDGNFPSIKQITYNSDCTKATVTVDYDAYSNSLDSFSLLAVGIVGSAYQSYNGVSADNLNLEISVVDESTGAVRDTIVYPRDFDDTTNQ